MRFTTTIKSDREFRRLYNKGVSAVRPCLVVYARRTRRDINRLGFTVTTKVGKAVTRNRVRRRLREIYRLHEEGLTPGFDLVVVARTRAARVSYARLEAEFLSACQELGVAFS